MHPTTPSRGQPCLVTNLSPKLTRLLHRSSPVDDGFLLLLPRLLRRRPRPGGIRSEPVPCAHHDRHAALSTAASSNRCQTPLAQCVSAQMSRASEFKIVAKVTLCTVFPKAFGNFWILILPQSFRLQPPFLFCAIRKAIGTQPADKTTPNHIIFLF